MDASFSKASALLTHCYAPPPLKKKKEKRKRKPASMLYFKVLEA